MDQSARFLMQVRLVLVVYRAESRRAQSSGNSDHMDAVTDRSFALLARAESDLDGELTSHPELVEALRSARVELGADRD
jgi:hypothetical protein